MDLKTAIIGDNFDKDFFERISYFSDDYFLDCDILIIDLRALKDELRNMCIREDECMPGYLQDQTVKYIRLKINERRLQLNQYFNCGGNLFVQMSGAVIEKFFQETEKGDIEELEIDTLHMIGLASADYEFEGKKGNNMVFSDQIFRDFFQEFTCRYESIYKKYKGSVTAKIRNTGAPISVIVSKGRGNILLLPEIRINAEDYEEFEYRSSVVLKSFQKLDQQLKTRYKAVPDIAIPEWCSAVNLSNEKAQIKKLDKLFEERDQIQQKIEQQQLYLTQYTNLKALLFESGTNLENRVENILVEFGFNVLGAEERRDDLIIQYRNDIAVIEIKGLKGSAAESNAAQLMKWVSTYHHDKGKRPKGILIVNPFKDKPLKDRTDHAFPPQMLPYCEKMELTLLTTTQLLGLYLDFKNSELTIKKIHRLLWDTVGRLPYEPAKIYL